MKRYDSIQVVRAIAMVVVFISHSYAFIANKYLWGAIGVTIFMVLSGFCLFISKSEIEPSLKTKNERMFAGGVSCITAKKILSALHGYDIGFITGEGGLVTEYRKSVIILN